MDVVIVVYAVSMQVMALQSCPERVRTGVYLSGAR